MAGPAGVAGSAGKADSLGAAGSAGAASGAGMAGSAGIVGGGSCGMGAPGDVGSALAGGMVGSAGASCAWTGAAIMSARALADNSVRVLTLSCCTWNGSEEHTYELQSPMRISYSGFCLKKKQQ